MPCRRRPHESLEEILKTRGTAPGIVYVFEVMENCMTYEPWHDKATHRTYFREAAQFISNGLSPKKLHRRLDGAFRYYLTTFGKTAVAAALKLKEMFQVPSLRGHLATP